MLEFNLSYYVDVCSFKLNFMLLLERIYKIVLFICFLVFYANGDEIELCVEHQYLFPKEFYSKNVNLTSAWQEQ